MRFFVCSYPALGGKPQWYIRTDSRLRAWLAFRFAVKHRGQSILWEDTQEGSWNQKKR